MRNVTVSRRGRLPVVALAVVVLSAMSSQAALAGKRGAGNLDGKFGSHGKVLTTFAAPLAIGTATSYRPLDGGGPETDVFDLGLQPSGKLIAMGFHNPLGTASYYALARYTDGVLDPSFGTDGRLVFNAGAGTPAGMAIQSDGKIVVAGSLDPSTTGCQADFLVQRLELDGVIDTTFGTNGQVVLDFGGCDSINAIAVGQGDAIVVAGMTGGGGSVAVARLTSDGDPDAGFGAGGKATLAGFGSGQGVVIQPSGRIVVGVSTDSGWGLAGFTSAGALDLSFGNAGTTSTSFGVDSSTTLASIALRSGGGIVAAGGNYDGSRYNIALAGYDAAGVLDPAFGSDGLVQTAISGEFGEDQAGGVAVQPDGKIVIAGWTCDANCDFVVARYVGSTGALDGSFGRGGFVTTDFQSGSGDLARSVVIEADGKIVAGGKSDALGEEGFALARYKP